MERQWIPQKEKIVSAWTDRYLHFGASASSAIELWHSSLTLKKYLGRGRSRLHIRDVLLKLNAKVNGQVATAISALNSVNN